MILDSIVAFIFPVLQSTSWSKANEASGWLKRSKVWKLLLMSLVKVKTVRDVTAWLMLKGQQLITRIIRPLVHPLFSSSLWSQGKYNVREWEKDEWKREWNCCQCEECERELVAVKIYSHRRDGHNRTAAAAIRSVACPMSQAGQAM